MDKAMRKLLLIIGTLLLSSSVAFAEPLKGKSSEVELYCEGQTWVQLGQYERRDTSAYLRISSNSVYMEISTVGFGTSADIKPFNSVSSGGNITLSPDLKGRPAFFSSYTINRFTGEFAVLPSSNQNDGKALFAGKCTAGKPLF